MKKPTIKAKQNPDSYLKSHHILNSPSSNFRTVCIGDSLTFGFASANYIKILENFFNVRSIPMDFINAGIDGEFAYNVAQRLDSIIACQPHFITLLIGSNDANSVIDAKLTSMFIEMMGLPQPPTKEWFHEMLIIILRRLQNETRAKIGVLSIPTIGENPAEKAFHFSDEYAVIIKEIVFSNPSIQYLPLHEKMIEYLKNSPSKSPQPYEKAMSILFKSVFRHIFLRQSWNTIGQRFGFQLHSDLLHLNDNGAKMIADLIDDFIVQNLPVKS